MLCYEGSMTHQVPVDVREDIEFSCDEAFFLAARALAIESLATPAGRSVVARSGRLTMEPLVIQYPDSIPGLPGPDGWDTVELDAFDRELRAGWAGGLKVRRYGEPGNYGYEASGWMLQDSGTWHDLVELARDAGLPVD